MSQELKSVIGNQSKETQSYCTQFTQSSNKHRKTIAEWGKILLVIKDGDLNPVDAEGNPLEGDDLHERTFSAICKELGVPRSTAYHYINIYLITSTYPEWLQQAATANNLNLAAQHVQDAFEGIRESIPVNPDSLQVSGVVAELKKAKADNGGYKHAGTPTQRFAQMIKDALDYAAKHKLIDKMDGVVIELQDDDRARLAKLTEILSSSRATA